MLHRIICCFSAAKFLTVDKDSAFTGEVIHFILIGINCQKKIISLFNHMGLRTERQIQIIEKMITGKIGMWPLYTAVAIYVPNIFVSPALSGALPI